jgi:hypothetical protein
MTTRTLTLLRDDLRDRADVQGMTVRHTDAELNRYLLQSARGLRAWLTSAGFSGFLEGTSPTALPTSPPTTGEAFLEVAWPSDAISIHGVDVNTGPTTTGKWYELDAIQFAKRRDYSGLVGCQPEAFLIRTLPKETPAATLSAGAIQIYPLSTLGLTYRIWYLPELPELTTDAHVFQGFDGDWIEWILWDAAIKVLYKDLDDAADSEGDQRANRERGIVQQRILANINRTQRSGPVTLRRISGRVARYGR